MDSVGGEGAGPDGRTGLRGQQPGGVSRGHDDHRSDEGWMGERDSSGGPRVIDRAGRFKDRPVLVAFGMLALVLLVFAAGMAAG